MKVAVAVGACAAVASGKALAELTLSPMELAGIGVVAVIFIVWWSRK